MSGLTNFELRRFLLIQTVCLAIVAVFLLFRDLISPAVNTCHFSWLFYLSVLLVIVYGILVQRFARANIRYYLLKVAGIYGFLTIAMLPMLFVW